MTDERLERLVCWLVPAAMVAMCAIGLVVGALVGVLWVRSNEPWCPTEGPCGVDYHGHVVEVTP